MDRKEENIDEIEPKFVFDDMADDMKKLALSCAHSAYSNLINLIFSHPSSTSLY